MRFAHKTNKEILTLLLLSVISIFAVSCSSAPRQKAYTATHSRHHKIIKIAKAQLGKPYHFGGINPRTGFDCSGLINYSYKEAGISVPRTTKQLYRTATPIQRNHLKAGDLVFFRINRKKISHVGLYLGNNKFIHAPSGGKRVNIANLNDKYWLSRFTRGGRI